MYAALARPIQNSISPIFPLGKKIMLNVLPNDRIKMYTGVSNPKTGHKARTLVTKTPTMHRAITGTSYGISL
jgi:hypothetical protein